MIEVNLVPDVKRELLRAQRQRNFVISIAIIVAIGFAAVTVLVAAYVYGAQTLMMKTSNDAIDREYATLSSVQDLDKMLTIHDQLQAVSSLDKNKNVTSRLYDMLNVVVPESPHNVRISSVGAELSAGDGEEGASSGAVVTIEGQTTGGYSSLEVFEKMIAAAVIEYKPAEGADQTGEINCGNEALQCRYLAVGSGERSAAVQVSEMSFGEDQDGTKMLYFNLSFTVVPELLSNSVSDVSMKIGKDGNVTDSYLGIPRAIFESRPAVDAREDD